MWRSPKSWLDGPGPSVALGTVADASAHIQRLLDAPDGSFLVIELPGVEDAFLQFTAGPDGIQIDHPLITPAQVEREPALQQVFAAAGFMPYQTSGSDGSRFLECDVPRDAAGAAILVERVLESVFGVTSSTELRFVGEGLPPAV
jgi:hypothetical protein